MLWSANNAETKKGPFIAPFVRVAASRARKQLRAENNAEFEFVAQPDICRHCARNYKQPETTAVLQETIAKLETSLAGANSEPGGKQGNRISREERMILNVTLINGRRLGDMLAETYRAQMRDSKYGKWIEIADVSLTHCSYGHPITAADRESYEDARMGIFNRDKFDAEILAIATKCGASETGEQS